MLAVIHNLINATIEKEVCFKRFRKGLLPLRAEMMEQFQSIAKNK